jgi:hypothetical protein
MNVAGPAHAPGTFSYDVVLPAAYAGVPAVAASATDPAATVAVTQAAGVPGAATVAVTGFSGTWSAPVSSDTFTIGFTQSIGAPGALRTGSSSKTLTFTLSTTTP